MCCHLVVVVVVVILLPVVTPVVGGEAGAAGVENVGLPHHALPLMGEV